VEAHVLKQHDAPLARFRNGRAHGRTDAVVELDDVEAGQLLQTPGHRRQAHRLDDLALGAAEVAHQHRAAAALQDLLDRRDRGANARVVGDRAARVLRHVEVDAHEDALPFQVQVVETRCGEVHRCHFVAPDLAGCLSFSLCAKSIRSTTRML
jgi:hypothetical protein